jgi:hypothetical protein
MVFLKKKKKINYIGHTKLLFQNCCGICRLASLDQVLWVHTQYRQPQKNVLRFLSSEILLISVFLMAPELCYLWRWLLTRFIYCPGASCSLGGPGTLKDLSGLRWTTDPQERASNSRCGKLNPLTSMSRVASWGFPHCPHLLKQ